MGIAAAAGIGAIGAVAGGLISSSGAQSAASTSAAASTYAADLTHQQYLQTRSDLQPYTTAGNSALASLRVALGLDTAGQQTTSTDSSGNTTTSTAPSNPLTSNGLTSGLTFQPTQAQLNSTPGYQWDVNQGLRGVENSASMQGRGVSGAAAQGAANAAVQYANNTLTTQQGIYQQNLQNVLSPLEYLTTTGQNAAATSGSLGQSATTTQGNYLTSAANSTAAGITGSSNALSSSLSGLSNSASNYLLYSGLNSGTGNVDNTATFVG